MFSFSRGRMIARLGALIGIALVTSASQYRCSSDGNGYFDSGNGQATFTTTFVLRDALGVESYTFASGEPIRFELVVRNRTNRTVTASAGSPLLTDFSVSDIGGGPVHWQKSDGTAYPQVVTDIEFAPLENRTFAFDWNQMTRAGTLPSAGQYEARALVYFALPTGDATAGELTAPTRTFTIR